MPFVTTPSSIARLPSAIVSRPMRDDGSATSRSTPGTSVTRTSARASSRIATWFATVSALML